MEWSVLRAVLRDCKQYSRTLSSCLYFAMFVFISSCPNTYEIGRYRHTYRRLIVVRLARRQGQAECLQAATRGRDRNHQHPRGGEKARMTARQRMMLMQRRCAPPLRHVSAVGGVGECMTPAHTPAPHLRVHDPCPPTRPSPHIAQRKGKGKKRAEADDDDADAEEVRAPPSEPQTCVSGWRRAWASA